MAESRTTIDGHKKKGGGGGGVRERGKKEKAGRAAGRGGGGREKEGERVHRSINQDNERRVVARRTSRQRRKGWSESGWWKGGRKEGRTNGRTDGWSERLYETFDTSTKPLPTIPKIRNLTVNLARRGFRISSPTRARKEAHD